MNNNIANADPKKVGELLHILGTKLGIPPEQLEKELSDKLSDPDTAADYDKLAEVLNALNAVQTKLEELYKRYGELIG